MQQAIESGDVNVEMVSESDDSDEEEKDHKKTGRDLFRQKVTKRNPFFNNGYGSEDDSEESESDEDDDDSDEHEQ